MHVAFQLVPIESELLELSQVGKARGNAPAECVPVQQKDLDTRQRAEPWFQRPLQGVSTEVQMVQRSKELERGG